MALLWTICVCGLFSVVLSASPECEELVKPLDMTDPSVLNGKWVFVAGLGQGTAKWQKYLEDLSSSLAEITVAGEGGKLQTRWNDRLGGQCIPGSLEMTLTGNKVNAMYEGVPHEGEYLQSCPDCLLLTDVSTEENLPCKYIFLMKREGGSVTEAELETLKKQAACLGIAQTVYTYTATDYCPL